MKAFCRFFFLIIIFLRVSNSFVTGIIITLKYNRNLNFQNGSFKKYLTFIMKEFWNACLSCITYTSNCKTLKEVLIKLNLPQEEKP